MVVSSIGMSLTSLTNYSFSGYSGHVLELDRANILLVQGNVSHRLCHRSAEPPDGDRKPFVEILGSQVREAGGHSDGMLRLKLEDGWELTEVPIMMAARMYTWNGIDFAWRVVAGDTAWIGEFGRTVVEEREKLR
jgi:hypothetical protein